jgi:hypothetical protein
MARSPRAPLPVPLFATTIIDEEPATRKQIGNFFHRSPARTPGAATMPDITTDTADAVIRVEDAPISD